VETEEGKKKKKPTTTKCCSIFLSPPLYSSFSHSPTLSDAFSSLPNLLPRLNPRWRSLDKTALARENTLALLANVYLFICLFR